MKVKINDKFYKVEIINGERIVEGKTVDEFLDTLPWKDIVYLAKYGWNTFSDEDKQTMMTNFINTVKN